jgi:hypothetical protein
MRTTVFRLIRCIGPHLLLLPAVLLFAVSGGAQQPGPKIVGTCGGSVGATINTPEPIFNGQQVNITMTITSSVSGGVTTNTESLSSFGVDLACSSGNLFGSIGCMTEPAGNPITYPAQVVSTTCKDASNLPVTWAVPPQIS